MKKLLILLISFFLSACGMNGASESQTQKYGEKVLYSDAKEIKFADFSIKFVGKREKKYLNENSPLKMVFYDFEVVKGDEKKTVDWSSGTGDIAPRYFEIGGNGFALELQRSDIIKGALGEGYLVIWKKEDFQKALEKK